MAKIISLGEALIDFVPAQLQSGAGAPSVYLRAAGGAPANVAVGLAKLGVDASFVGCFGADPFGRYLRDELERHGVDLSLAQQTDAALTAMAIVSLDAAGDRAFSFYGAPAAHDLLDLHRFDDAGFADADALHFGSITMIREPARAATLHAVSAAEAAGLPISFDPNYREALWPDAATALAAMREGIDRATIVKLSDDEATLLGCGCDLHESGRALWHPRLEAMLITRGARGCIWLSPDESGEIAAIPVEAVDTTGAGDAFTAAFLAQYLQPAQTRQPDIAACAQFATAAGTLATCRRGAIPSLPSRAEIADLLLAAPNRRNS